MYPEKELQTRTIQLKDIPSIALDWFRFFLHKWWLILLFGISGGIVGILIATFDKARYESRLTFALDESGGGGMGGALSLASAFGLDLGGSQDMFSGDNIIEILKSRRIIQGVLLQTDTINGKINTIANELLEISKQGKKPEKNSIVRNVSFPVGVPKEKFSYLQDSILFVLYEGSVVKNLTAQKVDKKLSIYELKFISPNERFSKIFITRLIAEASSFYTGLKNKHAKEVLDILENRVSTMKGAVKSAINAKAAIPDANMNPAYSAAQAPVQNKQLDITVYGGAYAELYKNMELARYRFLQSTPLLQLIDEPQYPMKKIKKGKFNTGILYGIVGLLVVFVVIIFWKLFTQQKEEDKL